MPTILRPCPNVIDCPGSDSPVINFSSESPDPPDFISTVIFGDSNAPPLPFPGQDGPWTATACGQTFTSFISQLDADLQALIAAYKCQKHLPGQPPVTCCNDEQCCTAPGPDGNGTFCIPAGSFCAPTCAEANQQAQAVGCLFARRLHASMSAIPSKVCQGTPYSTTVTARNIFGLTGVLLWDISSGSLPPGINFTPGFYGDTVTISGIPTQGGAFTFTLQAVNDAGNSVSRQYTICVTGITPNPAGSVPDALPDATLNVPYSNALVVTNCGTGPITYQITDGALPAGLALNPTTGIISGTPTSGPASFVFTVTATQAS